MNAARRQHEAPAVRIDDPAVVRVLRASSSMMRAAEKLAWLVLWQASRGGRDRIVMTSATLANEVGQTDAKAAREQLKNLLSRGLIDSSGPDRHGQWEMWVLSLDKAGMPRRFDGDPQLEIEFEDPSKTPRDDRDDPAAAPHSESPAADARPSDVLALPPARIATEGARSEPPTAAPSDEDDSSAGGGRSLVDEVAELRAESARGKTARDFAEQRGKTAGHFAAAAKPPAVLPRHVPSVLSEPSVPQVLRTLNLRSTAQPQCERSIQGQRSESARGKTAREFAADSAACDERGKMARDFAALAGRLPTEGEQRARVEDLAAKLMAAVRCPRLRQSPCLRAAWAVIEGRVPLADVDAVLRSLEAARPRLRAPASAYFVQAIKRLFAKRGIPWETER